MGLQFIIGKASKNHQAEIIKFIKAKVAQQERVFVIVPNHIKFESEVAILQGISDNQAQAAFSNVQVLSFTRLAWFFMRNLPIYQQQRLDSTGISMLIYQIVNDKQAELLVFDQEIHHPGFISQLVSQITEMQTGNILPLDIQTILQDADELNNDLIDKLHDLAIVYEEYIERIMGRYFDNNALLQLLREHLLTQDLTQTNFVISGFSMFTAQEQELVKSLIKQTKVTLISLILDRPAKQELPDSTSLFYQPARIFNCLYQYARENQVPYLPIINATQSRVNADLEKVEEYWIQSNNLVPITADKRLDHQAVEIIKTDNAFAELMQVTTKIRQLVATKQYRYRDFLILTRDLTAYQNILDPVFTMQQVPYFKDIQKSMKDAPLVELIAALLEVVKPDRKINYRYDDVMRLLKTELMLPLVDGKLMEIDDYREAVYLTENLVLKNGYMDHYWLQEEDWQYKWVANDQVNPVLTDNDRQINDQINTIRHFIKETLPPFYKRFYAAKNNRQAAEILFTFLQQTGVINRIETLRSQAKEKQNLNLASQLEQVYNTFINILDELALILGDEPFIAEDFGNLLQSGFENATFSQIPSTLDQVTVSESGMVQMNNRKITIMIGSNDENMPRQIVEGGLFSDVDIEQINSRLAENQFLFTTASQQIASEPYLNYTSFLSGSEKLILTYSSQTPAETTVAISPYVDRISNYFNVPIIKAAAIATNEEPVAPYVGSQRVTLHYAIQALQSVFDQSEATLRNDWQWLLNQLAADRQMKPLVERLLQSVRYSNQPVELEPKYVEALYGKTLNVSISQLELFYKNPYEYFLRYGLNLRKRDVFELSSQSTGQFFHDALDKIMTRVRSHNIELSQLNIEQINQLVTTTVQEMIADPQNFEYVILTTSNRMKYIQHQLKAVIQRMIYAISLQEKRTLMRPRQTELVFGQPTSNGLKGLQFELPENKLINVRGRIDRIDEVKINDKHYFGVVDYKSSERRFKKEEAYNGLSMQLLTYLDVLKNNLTTLGDGQEALIAGALYLHVVNDTFKLADIIKNGNDLDKLILNNHRYRGILVNDEDLIDNLDLELKAAGTGKSAVFSIGKTKSGAVSKTSEIMLLSDLDKLLARNEELIVEAGQQIYAGNISLAPADINPRPTETSDYRAIMNFDPLMADNNYKKLKSKAEVEAWLKGKEGEQDNGVH